MYQCSWKENFNVECPTCGFQRSADLLVHGEISASFDMFPATIPFFVLVIFLVLHIVFNFKSGSRIIIGLFSITVILIMVNFGFKISQ
tara:strand:- start:10316 stop:10579 length:264 start_codon:yes stop_codon:yes gene_type:complete